MYWLFFFFNDTATTEIYTLSLHDALPILMPCIIFMLTRHKISGREPTATCHAAKAWMANTQKRQSQPFSRFTASRSEEHTSELQSRQYLVCRLLLEKKNKLSLQSDRICNS